MMYRNLVIAASISVPTASAFVSPAACTIVSTSSKTSLQSTVDPAVVTKKEYQDICGVSFDDDSLEERLTRTKFLYPKHVEVIEDLAPIAGTMVDDVVRDNMDISLIFATNCLFCCPLGYWFKSRLTHLLSPPFSDTLNTRDSLRLRCFNSLSLIYF